MTIEKVPKPVPATGMNQAQYDAAWNAFLAKFPGIVDDIDVATQALNFNSTNSASTTSLTAGTGLKSFTIETDKSWLSGMPFTLARTSDGSGVWMRGICDTYDSGTGAFTGTVSDSQGTAGPYTDWTISFGIPQTLAPGSKVLIATISATDAVSVDIEDSFDEYSKYVIEADGVTFSIGPGSVYARMKLDGAYVTTSTYDYVFHDTATATTNQPRIDMGAGVNYAANSVAEITLSFKNPTSTTQPKLLEFKSLATDGVTLVTNDSKTGVGINGSTSALEGIRIYPSAGTITGTFKLYGITG